MFVTIWSVEFFDRHPGVTLGHAQESSSSALISILLPMTDPGLGEESGIAANIPENIQAFSFSLKEFAAIFFL